MDLRVYLCFGLNINNFFGLFPYDFSFVLSFKVVFRTKCFYCKFLEDGHIVYMTFTMKLKKVTIRMDANYIWIKL